MIYLGTGIVLPARETALGLARNLPLLQADYESNRDYD
jgi:hypothetical protein